VVPREVWHDASRAAKHGFLRSLKLGPSNSGTTDGRSRVAWRR
jgi:hypothetical protein